MFMSGILIIITVLMGDLSGQAPEEQLTEGELAAEKYKE